MHARFISAPLLLLLVRKVAKATVAWRAGRSSLRTFAEDCEGSSLVPSPFSPPYFVCTVAQMATPPPLPSHLCLGRPAKWVPSARPFRPNNAVRTNISRSGRGAFLDRARQCVRCGEMSGRPHFYYQGLTEGLTTVYVVVICTGSASAAETGLDQTRLPPSAEEAI